MPKRFKSSRSSSAKTQRTNYQRLEDRRLLAADFSSNEQLELVSVVAAPNRYVEVQWENESRLAVGDSWLIWQDESSDNFRTQNNDTISVGDQYFFSETASRTSQSGTPEASQKLEVIDEISEGLFLLSGSENFSFELVTQSVAEWIPGATVEPDFVVTVNAIPNDPLFEDLWGLNNTGQTSGTEDADIDAVEAWDVGTGSSDVVVAVIDTGIDYTHPDLIDNIWVNPGEIAGDGIDNDGNGFIDDIHGWDFAYNDSDPYDRQGHGTHVAGTIGASGNNGIGVTGVSQDVSLMAIKFLNDSGSGTTSGAIRAIEYTNLMKQRGTNIVLTNNSWGGGGYSSSLRSVIADAMDLDILFVAAAGNESTSSHSYPAGYDLDNIISVASTDRYDELSSFSNFSTSWVDLAAPGSSILSTRAGGGYETLSGTSMASPHVAGAAALLAAVRPDLSALEIKAQLLENVDHLPQLSSRVATSGRLNVNSLFSASLSFDAENYLSGSSIGIDVFNQRGFAPGAVVTVQSTSGDSEVLEITDTGGAAFSLSIDSDINSANPNDGILQVAAFDTITVSYEISDGVGGIFTDSAEVVTDDYGDDADSASGVDLPFNVAGSIDVVGDEDWFSFSTVAGWQHEFEIALDSLAISKLSLYDTDGVTLLEQSSATEVSWVAPASGTYYLSVEHGFGSGVSDYQISGFVPTSAVEFDKPFFVAPGVVEFDLFDATGFAPGAIVTIESSSGDVENIAVSAGTSFEFSASIDSVVGSANFDDGILQVSSGDLLTVTYLDPEDGNGGSVTSIDTATIVFDDHGDDSQSATALDFPINFSAAIDTFADQDWFSFSTIAGFQYEFEIAFDDLLGSELTLYDTDGLTALESASFSPSIVWIAPSSDTYYLSYAGLNADETGGFQLLGSSTVPRSSVEFDATSYYVPETLNFVVNDSTGFVAGATVLIESSSGDAESFLISAAGTVASLSIDGVQGSPNPNDGVLQVASGDLLTATYFDADDGLGETFTATGITTAFTDDYGDDAATATLLSIPASVSGEIEIAGDQDWFQFDAVAGTQYRFEVPVHDESMDLRLYNIDGTTQLERDTGTSPLIFWLAPSDGTYFLSLESSSDNDVGGYELSVVVSQDDHGDDATTATLLGFPASISGSIEGPGDQDWFRFTAVAGETFRFEVPEHDELPEIILYDTDGATQLERDYFSDPSIAWDAPSDGTYYLSVEKYYSDDYGSYELIAEKIVDDHGDDAATATLLNFPASISGSIEVAGDQDWFRFTANAGETFRFEVPEHDESPEIILYDTDGTTQLERDTFSDPSILWTATSGGTYYLSMENYSSSRYGDYELTAEIVVDDHGDDAATATLLNFPANISGSIEVAGDQDWFRFTANVGDAFRFEVPEYDSSTELILYDTDGSTQLERDVLSDPSIVWTAATSGTYYLSMKDYFSSGYGNYELTAELVADDHGDSAATATLLNLPANISGSIEIGGDQDWFRFTANVGETFRFEIPVHDENVELIVYDTNGTTELERDFFDEPSILWSASRSGTYYVRVANYFSDYLGDYELTADKILDNHGDDFTTATLFELPGTIPGFINSSTDQDYFRFSATGGTSYRFELADSENYGQLKLYDTDGVTLLDDDRRLRSRRLLECTE